MYLESYDYQTIWGLAHNWTGDDPDTTDPQNVPEEIRLHIHRLASAVFRRGLPARHKRFALFIDDSFFTMVVDFRHFVRFYKCIHSNQFDKAYLSRIFIKRSDVLHWCQKEFLTPPPLWNSENQSINKAETEDDGQGWYEELTVLRRQKVGNLEIAQKLWQQNPSLTYQEIYEHPAMKEYGTQGAFTFNAFKKAARRYAPEEITRGGRRFEKQQSTEN